MAVINDSRRQGGLPVRSDGVDVSVKLKEDLSELHIVSPRNVDQRGMAVHARGIGVSTKLQQRSDQQRVPSVTGRTVEGAANFISALND